MENLSGQEITGIYPHYEHIIVVAGDKRFFISSDELVKVLSEFDFTAVKKKTRTWLHVDIDDWRIERFDEPRTY